MNINRIYNRQIMGLDNNVWSVMLILSVLSLGLLSYKLMDNKKCISFTVKIKSSTFPDSIYYVGENLNFISSTKQNITWNFGDKTDNTEGAYVNHKFTTEGLYRITASSDADCDGWSKIIKIINTPQSSYIREGEKIIGPASTTNTTDVEFVCTVLADTYVWSVKNYPGIRPMGSAEKIKFRFPNAGTYTVQVILDNDRVKSYTKEITVNDVLTPKTKIPEPKILVPDNPISNIKIPEKLPEPKPEETESKPKFLQMTDETFLSLLQSIQKNQNDITVFNKFLCSGGATKVRENSSDYTTLTELCQKLRGKYKKATIKSVHLKPDPDNPDCILIIDVEIKKKGGFLGL